MRARWIRVLALLGLLGSSVWGAPLASAEAGTAPTDLLSFAAGALPISLGGDAEALRVGMSQAMGVIDGDARGFGVTPKPGGAETEVVFVYRLPALTTFTEFLVPGIGETPSPSQTFFREVVIEGSAEGAEGPVAVLASGTLRLPESKEAAPRISVTESKAVRWVRVRLRGGLSIEREATFFEFSELVGHGRQESVPLLEAFSGKWKGRGVAFDLVQDGVGVAGCYDRVGDLRGTVSGNLLRATGTHRTSGVASVFLLTVGDDGGITGVRSTNGAPFKVLAGAADPDLKIDCPATAVAPPGCGDIVHGIQFGFDSAEIRPESAAVLDSLAAGLKAEGEARVTIVGHTSSEGTEAYNLDLSKRRAQSVVEALARRGLAEERLEARGAGEGSPIADNATEAGRSLNRRVEIECQSANGG